MTGIKRILIKHAETNLLKYIIAFALFAAGVVLGVTGALGNSADTTDALTSEIGAIAESMNEADLDNIKIMKTSLFKNMRYFILIFISGFSLWFIPVSLATLFTCGFSCGFTTAFMAYQFGSKGLAMAMVSILPGLFISIPIYIILAVIATNNAIKKRQSRYDKNDFIIYLICFILFFVISLLAPLADAFATPEIIRQIGADLKGMHNI